MHLDARAQEHHDAFMRTTLTLDPDVARLLEEEAHRRRKSFKEVVNDALRRGLSLSSGNSRKAARFRVTPHAAQLRPGIDRAGLNRLADELEDAALLSSRKDIQSR
jgi:hypothetical protein